MMGDFVEIVEVGPRDGLQNEARLVPTREKIALVDRLSRAGFRRIEAASFVSPKLVPQMADGAEVLTGIERNARVGYVALTPNMKGFERAANAGADWIAVFGSASEGFSRANIGCSIEESLERFAPVLAEARARELPARGYVSCVAECPYDGPTPPARVAMVSQRLSELGCREISLGDTLGRAGSEDAAAMLKAVLEILPANRLAGHFHDTAGRALENVEAALELGLRIFDASVGGLGGCPFAPGAAGNVATGAVAARAEALGYETGLDASAIEEAAAMARALRSGGIEDSPAGRSGNSGTCEGGGGEG